MNLMFYDDLKLLKGSITISYEKRFKEISCAKLKEVLQGCMKNIWLIMYMKIQNISMAFVEVKLKLNGLYSIYWQSIFFMIMDRLI